MIGSLIVQDILAILMMVLLSTVAVSSQFSGSDLLMSVLKLVFFLVIWFLGGIFIIPTVLKKIKPLLTDETLLIISLALCLTMVIFAANVGFSPALGAFIMGSIIAETTQAEHIEHLVKPVKDLFGAVFFVSVGMLINPEALYEHAIPVVITFVCDHFWAIYKFYVWCIIIWSTLERFDQNWNEFVTNWGIFVYYSHFGLDFESHQYFFISYCSGCFGCNGFHDSVYD